MNYCIAGTSKELVVSYDKIAISDIKETDKKLQIFENR